MKILHVSALYYPVIGGSEILTQWTSEKMAALGHAVTIFTSDAARQEELYTFRLKADGLKSREMINGVDVHRFPIDPLYSFLFSASFSKLSGSFRLQKIIAGDKIEFFYHGPILKSLDKAISVHKPDILTAFNNYPWTTYAAGLAKKRYGLPLVIFPMTHISNPWAFSKNLRDLYLLADFLIVSTGFERDHLIAQGVANSKISIMGNPVDLGFLNSGSVSFRQRNNIPSNVPVISYVGRKVNGKGIEHLIDAMPQVWRKHPDAHLILAGHLIEPFRETLRNCLASLGADGLKRVININSFDDADKRSIYEASDVFAMPSNVDSFGIAYLEAWSCGLPVIACRNTAQESFIENEKDGLLVEYGNKDSIAEAINQLIESPEKAKAMGQKGKEKTFREYSIERYVSGILDIYNKLV